MLNVLTLCHLGQFNEIHYKSRTHQVLWNYILILWYFFGIHYVWRFKYTSSILPLLTYLVLEFFGYSGTFFLFCLHFLPSFWGTWEPEKKTFTKSTWTFSKVCFLHSQKSACWLQFHRSLHSQKSACWRSWHSQKSACCLGWTAC